MSKGTSAAALVRSLERLTFCDGIFITRGVRRAPVRSWAMWLMHSGLLARVYEPIWRPAVVRASSTLTYAVEDALVDRYLRGRSGLRILDLCCGTARASRRWIDLDAEVLGVDMSPVMLREARRRCPNERLVLVHSDAGRAVARADEFDAAFCFAALHLLEDPNRVMRAAAAAVQSGGVFFAWVAVSGGAMRFAPVRWAAQSLGVRPWEPGSLAAAMNACGFAALETLTFGAVEFVVGQRRS